MVAAEPRGRQGVWWARVWQAGSETDRRQAGERLLPRVVPIRVRLAQSGKWERVGRRERWAASEAMTGGPRCRGWKPTAKGKGQTEALRPRRGERRRGRAGSLHLTTCDDDARGRDPWQASSATCCAFSAVGTWWSLSCLVRTFSHGARSRSKSAAATCCIVPPCD